MIKKLVLIALAVALASSLPTASKTTTHVKKVAILPTEKEDMKTAETFATGYHTTYPSLGWRPNQKPFVGPVGSVYGGAVYQVGYPAIAGGYGLFGSNPVVGGGAPIIAGGGGYGWRDGVNRWAV